MYESILVTGGRSFKDHDLVVRKIDENLETGGTLLFGDAAGADRLAFHHAYFRGIPYKRYVAEWDKFGKGAGHIRNQEMVDELLGWRHYGGSAVLVLAFATDPSVEFASRGGTADCLRRVRKAELPYEFHVSALQSGDERWRIPPGEWM